MSTTDFSEFKSLFVATARKHLENIRTALSSLKKNTGDKDAMNNIYIAAHSLKGESLAMGYMTNSAVSQLIEKIFHAAKDGSLTLTDPILTTTLQSVEKLSDSIDCVEKEDKECILTDEQMSLEKVSGISLG